MGNAHQVTLSFPLPFMKCGVGGFVGGSRIATLAHGELDPAEILHVGAVIELIGVAGCGIFDEEADWPPCSRPRAWSPSR